MAWEIEGTDEFAAWFRALTEGEKEDVIASVDLLEARGPQLGFPIRPASTGRGTRTCANCASNMRDGHTGYFTRSIRAAQPSSCWAATRPATTAGT